MDGWPRLILHEHHRLRDIKTGFLLDPFYKSMEEVQCSTSHETEELDGNLLANRKVGQASVRLPPKTNDVMINAFPHNDDIPAPYRANVPLLDNLVDRQETMVLDKNVELDSLVSRNDGHVAVMHVGLKSMSP
jgi:hypothetical protein